MVEGGGEEKVRQERGKDIRREEVERRGLGQGQGSMYRTFPGVLN